MTPVHGWNEQDYYRASRAARAAWQQTNQQLEIAGLEEADADDGNSPVSVSSSPVPLSPWTAAIANAAIPAPGSTTTTGPDRHSPEQDGQAQRRSF